MSRLAPSIVAATLGLASLLTGVSSAQAALGSDLPAAESSRPLRHEAPKDELGSAGDPEPLRAPESLTLGARAFMAPGVGGGALGWGLDEAYSLIPNVAVGGQYLTYAVDQGADPKYCDRCVNSGKAALVFAEGRLWPHRWLTPYGRAGGGLSFINGQPPSGEAAYSETDATLLAEAGIELHHRWLSSRLFGFQLGTLGSKLNSEPFRGFGVQLGARF
jgi:hypothetical protein